VLSALVTGSQSGTDMESRFGFSSEYCMDGRGIITFDKPRSSPKKLKSSARHTVQHFVPERKKEN
jgi:hypothetical protein